MDSTDSTDSSVPAVPSGSNKPRVNQRGQARWRRLLHVVPVHPGELLGVEHGGAVTDASQIKAAGHFVGSDQLLAVTRRPAEQREVVHERFGK